MDTTDDATLKLSMEESLRASEERFHEIIERTPAGVCITNEYGMYEYVNPAYCKIYQYSADELIGKHFTLVVPEQSRKYLSELHERFLTEKVEIRGEWEVVNKTGETLTILADAAHITGNDRRPKKVTFVIDITERKRAERELKLINATLEQKVGERTAELLASNEQLRKSKAHFIEAQEVAKIGSWEWVIREDRIIWSDEVFRIFGVNPEEFEATYENYMACVHPDDRELLAQKVTAAVQQSKPYVVEHRIVLPDGRLKFVFGKGKVAVDREGNVVRLFGIVQDVTEKKRIEHEVRMLSNAIEESINSIFITDASGSIVYVNKAFENVTGYVKEEVLGQNPRLLSTGHASRETYQVLWESITAGDIWRGELKNKRKNGEPYWVNSTILPVWNESGKIVKFMAIQEDISQKYLAERTYRYLSSHDQLTGLWNRKYFIQQIEKKLFTNIPAALVLFDLDDFNYINETYGHNTGDDLLRRIADFLEGRIRGKFGDEALLGRIGEDKFALFLENSTSHDALLFAEQLRENFFELRFSMISSSLSLSASIAVCPEHGKTIDELLSALDAALFLAKRGEKNRCRLFSKEDAVLAARSFKFQQRERILKALEEDRFEPWFQPILSLKDRRVHHFEVLARMRDEQGNIVLPGTFISAAESFGFIGRIDNAVAEKAMQTLRILHARGEHVSFALNLSGKEIEDNHQLQSITETISRTGVTPQHLIFEITETAAIQDLNQAVVFVNELKKIGCSFALDDFGVGFTSFNYLRDLNVDYVKIDGAFIRKLNENAQDQAIVKAMTDVSKGFQIQTIAEFVENEAVLGLLHHLSVDYAQGFFIGPPKPEPVFTEPS